MQKYFLLFMFLLLSLTISAQPSTMRAAFKNVASTTPVTSATYAGIGFFFDSDGLGYSVSDIKTDTTLLQDNRGYLYRVRSVSGTSPVTLEFDPLEASADMNTGFVLIADPVNFDTTLNILPEVGTDVVDKNRASSETRFREKMDSLKSDLQTQITAIVSGGNLAVADQLLTADRLISGSDSYELTLDSLLIYHNHADQKFLTEGPTDLANLISVASRWDTLNTGLSIVEELGVRFNYLQTVENDTITRVYTTPESAGMLAWDRDAVGNNYEGADFNVTATEIHARTFIAGNVTAAEVIVGPRRVKLAALDSIEVVLEDFNELLTTVVAIDTLTDRLYLKTISPLSNQWYDATNSGSTIANATGTTFARTSSTIGTFSIPSGVEPSEFQIYHNTSQNPGTTYKIRFNYAGSVTYNNNFTDMRPPTVHVGNATAVVANAGVADNSNRYTYSLTTGSVNLETSITGFIDDVGYFELTLDNVDSAGGANDIIITVKF